MNKLNNIYKFFFLLLSGIIFTGCNQPTFINLTSTNISQNPSGIYTLQTEVDIQDRNVNPDTVKVSAVVGGESISMVQDPINLTLWSCDYKLPSGFDEATYYFQVDYNVIADGGLSSPRTQKSELQTFRLENRYVGNLASYRGPVGAEIAVQGRGFTKYDSITIGGKETKTNYLSENELRFILPPLPSGVDYPVQLIGGPHGALDIGNFRVDESVLSVSPSKLEIQSGSSNILLFKIDYDAPEGGLKISVKTDIPNSVIMPEARINQGDKTVNITVKGGEVGEGKLVISAPGFQGVEIPVRVF